MTWDTAVELVKAVAWPLLVGIIFFVVKEPLLEVLPFLREVKVKDVSFKLGEQAERERLDRLERELQKHAGRQAASADRAEEPKKPAGHILPWVVGSLSRDACRYLLHVAGRPLTLDEHVDAMSRYTTASPDERQGVPPWALKYLKQGDLQYAAGYVTGLVLNSSGFLFTLRVVEEDKLFVDVPYDVQEAMKKRLEV